MMINRPEFTIAYLFFCVLCAECVEKRFNVFKLEGPTKIERDSSNILDIHCYIGKPKTIINLWKSVKLILNIPSERFTQYEGYTPEDVWNAYVNGKSLWSGSFFSWKKSPGSIRLDPFNTTCIAIKTDEKYALELDVQNVDYKKLGLLVAGMILFIYSRSLGENVMFFYFSGITLGICASFMILVYFLSKMLPGKPIVYSAMIGGWTLGAYALQLLWSNFQPLLVTHHTYVAWYTLIMGFISFIICYKMGPPKDQRNKNLITWTLQAAGLTLMYFSTEVIEAFGIMASSIIIIKCIPNSWISGLKKYWRIRNPPKQKLLSQEEYYKQGQIETQKALDELRGYCSSPECPQWKLMLKLKNPKKFADFMETSVHLSDEEVSDYDNSDMVIRRRNITNHKINNHRAIGVVNGNTLEVSSDSSFSSEDY